MLHLGFVDRCGEENTIWGRGGHHVGEVTHTYSIFASIVSGAPTLCPAHSPIPNARALIGSLVTPHRAQYYDTVIAMCHVAWYLFREFSTPPKRYDVVLVLKFHTGTSVRSPFCNISHDDCPAHHKNKRETVLRFYHYKHRAI